MYASYRVTVRISNETNVLPVDWPLRGLVAKSGISNNWFASHYLHAKWVTYQGSNFLFGGKLQKSQE